MADLGAPEPRSSEATGSPPAGLPSNETAAPLRGVRRALLGLLYWLPKNVMSRWVGRFAGVALPAPVQRAEIRLFARVVGVDLTEMRDEIDAFASLQQFFTRALRAGARPLEGDERCLVAPCDGAWGESGRVESGTLLQVKGRSYRVADLLGGDDLAAAFEGGCYATFYLSPRDYHRFHTPTAGRFTRVDYFPGALWPVNSIGLQGVDGLFARNERVCAYLAPDLGNPASAPSDREPALEGAEPLAAGAAGEIAMVAVGATMVGSIRLTFDEVRTNEADASTYHRMLGERAPRFERGQEWGHFEFGSTIVMLAPAANVALEPRPPGTKLRLGEAIGRLRD